MSGANASPIGRSHQKVVVQEIPDSECDCSLFESVVTPFESRKELPLLARLSITRNYRLRGQGADEDGG
jgi:hypothetical protein